MANFQELVARATDSFAEIIAYYISIIALCGSLFSMFEDKPLFESFWWGGCPTGLTIGCGYDLRFGKLFGVHRRIDDQGAGS